MGVMAASPDRPPVLHYAPAPSRRRRRYLIFGILCLVAVGLTGWLAWRRMEYRALEKANALRIAQQIARQQRMLAEQQRLLAQIAKAEMESRQYQAPAGQVILTLDPARIKALSDGEFVYEPVFHNAAASLGMRLREPACWTEFKPSVFYSDADTAGFVPGTGGYATQDAGIAFLHERTPPDGPPQLVRVQIGAIQTGKFVFKPLIARRHSAAIARPQPSLGIFLAAGDTLTIFAGQPDPADPARFTIDCEINTTRTTIDGHLADADTLHLLPHAGFIDTTQPIHLWFPPGSHHPTPTTRPVNITWP